MTDLGTLGGAYSSARAINNNGQVVGGAYNAGAAAPFSYNNGTMTDLGTFGGWCSYARGINDSGQVVGTAETALPGVYHGFVYGDGTMTDLQSRIDPSSGWSLRSATAINDSGSIVGWERTRRARDGFLMTPITRPYARISLPTTYTNLRMMQGSTAAPEGVHRIDTPGNTPTSYTLSASAWTHLTFRHGRPGRVTPVPSPFRWADTAATGSRTGSITLANVSDPDDPGTIR